MMSVSIKNDIFRQKNYLEDVNKSNNLMETVFPTIFVYNAQVLKWHQTNLTKPAPRISPLLQFKFFLNWFIFHFKIKIF